MSKLIVISAPSGAGKTSLVQAMVDRFEKLVASVSYTTRPRRDGEKDGVDYYFVGRTQFEEMNDRGEFLEYAKVFGNLYGTSLAQIKATREKGFDVILEIDWQGARNIAQHFGDVLTIFILPPSITALRERLVSRGKDDETVIERRMRSAADEMSHYPEYNYLVINDDFEQAVEELANIISLNGRNSANLRENIVAKYPALMASIADF